MAYSSSPARSDPGTVPPQAYSTPGAVVNTSQTESYLDEDAVPLPGDWETLFVTESVNTWFEKCHQWFTILHERATKHAARRSDARYIHIFKAIVAVVSADDHASPQVSSISARMRDDVIRHGLGAASLRSMQSLLILTNHFYSRGELIQFGNVLAICQR